ncbi:(2,3-dihydroxybenzoyl)adenylate synthase [Gordonia zhaorongruii]|uniref:(2,3-dihydroxybenzoyl)adenylate synthase n=1 Tax=Gordonia zhaorongruii TaxID=2597659 RepID=UPI00104A4AA5|nr:AMP-binding protein [Gordonia zhaorongruii]
MTQTTAQSDLADGFAPHRTDPAADYDDAGLYRGRPLWSDLVDAAAMRPDSPAVTDAADDRTLTYSGLLSAADRRAAGFQAAGLRAGDRAVVQMNNSAEFAVTFFGLLRAGVVPVMTLPAHRISEIAHLAHTSGAVAYLTEDGTHGYDFRELAIELVDRVPGVRHVFTAGDPGRFTALPDAPHTDFEPPTVSTDLPALLLVSGGTTGLPKLIARTHDDYEFNARRSAEIAGLTADDVYLAALPAAHNFPLSCPGALGMIGVGGHSVFTADPSPDNAFAIVEKYRVSVVALVPALAQLWGAATEWEEADTSSLRLLQVGGSKLAESDAVDLDAAFGPVVQQVFGMAEGLICYSRLDDARSLVHVSQGSPMSEFDEVRIVDEDGTEVADGDEGELLTRGPYTIRGYYRAPEHNERSFTDDGFYRSGDLVRRLGSGHLAVTGRIKDTIVRAGENVAADDVEENLLAHPSVRQAAVVGEPDDVVGERIRAVVIVGRGVSDVTLPELREFLTSRGLASFKLPDRLSVVEALPVTAVGKIDKKAVRASLS